MVFFENFQLFNRKVVNFCKFRKYRKTHNISQVPLKLSKFQKPEKKEINPYNPFTKGIGRKARLEEQYRRDRILDWRYSQ